MDKILYTEEDQYKIIANIREAKLDKIRAEQMEQVKNRQKKEMDELSREWQKFDKLISVALGAIIAGASIPMIAATIVEFTGPLPVSFAIRMGALTLTLIVGGFSTSHYAKEPSISEYKLNCRHKKERVEREKIGDDNRSYFREKKRVTVKILKRKLAKFEDTHQSLVIHRRGYLTDKEIEYIKHKKEQIKREEEILLNSSPSRKELAKQIRPGLVERLNRIKQID